jgi:ferritin-like protein
MACKNVCRSCVTSSRPDTSNSQQQEETDRVPTTYHEPTAELSARTRSIHRALATLMEELEAVDWYQQRLDVSTDDQLASIFEHNRDEEIEHAAMALEWLRREMPEFDEKLRTYLFTSEPIVEVEESATGNSSQGGSESAAATSKGSGGSDLGIGTLQKGT